MTTRILSMIPAPPDTELVIRTFYYYEDRAENHWEDSGHQVVGYAVVEHPHPSGASSTEVEAVFYDWSGLFTESQYLEKEEEEASFSDTEELPPNRSIFIHQNPKDLGSGSLNKKGITDVKDFS